MISKGFWVLARQLIRRAQRPRHICLFVQGIRASGSQPLPGPAVTQNDIEAMFGGDATA
jgi:hypothetical protein